MASADRSAPSVTKTLIELDRGVRPRGPPTPSLAEPPAPLRRARVNQAFEAPCRLSTSRAHGELLRSDGHRLPRTVARQSTIAALSFSHSHWCVGSVTSVSATLRADGNR